MADDSKTLNQVIAEVKAAELTKQQDEIMHQKPEASISAIRGRWSSNQRKPRGSERKDFGEKDKNQKPCYRCGGKPSHTTQKCTAKEATAITEEQKDTLQKYATKPNEYRQSKNLSPTRRFLF